MALSTQPYKGTRDFYPEEMRIRKWMFAKLRAACESFGYEEYDTPILEPIDLYTAKTSEEIVNEQTYSFEDRGGRRVVMRPEMTPSVSRIVAARRQELGYPARLYSIPNCFRYERQQRGRLREFWQLNADLFGVKGIEADIELIQLADACMKAFGAKEGSYSIKINSRNFMKQRSTLAGPRDPDMTPNDLLRILDSWNKDEQGARKKIGELFERPEVIFGMMDLKNEDENESIFVDEMKTVLSTLKSIGVTSVEYDPTIARGFDYYTDIVFEVFDANPENNRSMFGGGRYDGLVGAFGVEPVPTVGFGMGDVTLQNFLESNNLIPDLRPATDVAVLLVGDTYVASQDLISVLRSGGLNVAVDATDRKLDKKLKSAAKNGTPYVIFVGETELNEEQFTIKDLVTGDEEKHPPERLVAVIKDLQS